MLKLELPQRSVHRVGVQVVDVLAKRQVVGSEQKVEEAVLVDALPSRLTFPSTFRNNICRRVHGQRRMQHFVQPPVPVLARQKGVEAVDAYG